MRPSSEVEEEKEEESEYEEVVEEVEEDEDEEEEVVEEIEEVEDSEEEAEEAVPEAPIAFQQPKFSSSITRLQSLHFALTDFLLQYTALNQTLEFISSSINHNHNHNPTPTPTSALDTFDHLGFICRTGAFKPLRRFISAHLSDPDHLRREVPNSLKLSTQPAKLVLDAIGKFYIQGRNAFEIPGSQLAEVRRAGVLLLELYLIAGCPEGKDSRAEFAREKATEAALSWRARMMREGGVESACGEDALGLLLLLAGFGIPEGFRVNDLCALVRLSNAGTKRDLLRKSPLTAQKIPDIIKDLIKKEMHIEAVELVCAFGLEEKFPPVPSLSAFVKKVCDVGEQQRRERSFSSRSLKEANENQLAALKSVMKFLEVNNLDGRELASFNINEKIATIEREILKEQPLLYKNTKRKAPDVEPFWKQGVQTKQLRPYLAEASHGIRQTHERYSPVFPDYRHIYSGYIANDVPVPKQASPGLVGRCSMGLLARNMCDPAGSVWQADGTGYEGPARQSSLEARYTSATAGQNYHLSGAAAPTNRTEGRNPYQYAENVSGRNLAPAVETATTSGHMSYSANPDHQSSFSNLVNQASFYTNSCNGSAYTNEANQLASAKIVSQSTYVDQDRQSAYTNQIGQLIHTAQAQQSACTHKSTYVAQSHQSYSSPGHQAYYSNQIHQSAYTNPASQSYYAGKGQPAAYSNPELHSTYVNQGNQLAYTNSRNQAYYADQGYQVAYANAEQQTSHVSQGHQTVYANPEQHYQGHQLVYANPDQHVYTNQGSQSAHTDQSQQLAYTDPDQQGAYTNPEQQQLPNSTAGNQLSYTDKAQPISNSNIGSQATTTEQAHQSLSTNPEHQDATVVAA